MVTMTDCEVWRFFENCIAGQDAESPIRLAALVGARLCRIYRDRYFAAPVSMERFVDDGNKAADDKSEDPLFVINYDFPLLKLAIGIGEKRLRVEVAVLCIISGKRIYKFLYVYDIMDVARSDFDLRQLLPGWRPTHSL